MHGCAAMFCNLGFFFHGSLCKYNGYMKPPRLIQVCTLIIFESWMEIGDGRVEQDTSSSYACTCMYIQREFIYTMHPNLHACNGRGVMLTIMRLLRNWFYFSYTATRLLAATYHCCAGRKLSVLAPQRLAQAVPSFVQSAVGSLPSLFAGFKWLANVYYNYSCTGSET